jgi:hypothetical protein
MLIRAAGLDPQKAPRLPNKPLKWRPVLVLPASDDPDKSRLIKSIGSNVNDRSKKSYFLVMVTALFSAATTDDFAQFFNGTNVIYKTAHKFLYSGKWEIVHELKLGQKDRIYLYPYSDKSGKYIFILEVLHKNQNPTPDDVKARSEDVIKLILTAKMFKLKNPGAHHE